MFPNRRSREVNTSQGIVLTVFVLTLQVNPLDRFDVPGVRSLTPMRPGAGGTDQP